MAPTDLENGKPTKTKVSRAIRAVAKWKECAELLKTTENIAKADKMLAKLQTILEGMGAKLIKSSEAKGEQILPPRSELLS
jgi:TATA-binding protein-associated factor